MARAKSHRKIHMEDGSVWEYRLKQGGIWLRRVGEPGRLYFDFCQLTSIGWDNLERASWKGYWPAIRPCYIKAFIKRRVLGKECPCQWAGQYGRIMYDAKAPDPAIVRCFREMAARMVKLGMELPEKFVKYAPVSEEVDEAGLNPAA